MKDARGRTLVIMKLYEIKEAAIKEMYRDVSLTQYRYAKIFLFKEYSSDPKAKFARLKAMLRS